MSSSATYQELDGALQSVLLLHACRTTPISMHLGMLLCSLQHLG